MQNGLQSATQSKIARCRGNANAFCSALESKIQRKFYSFTRKHNANAKEMLEIWSKIQANYKGNAKGGLANSK